MTSDEMRSTANIMANAAYQLFHANPHVGEALDEVSFPMYSHDRFSKLVIEGMVLRLFERGFSSEEVKLFLKSKKVRHLLDREEDRLVELGKAMADQMEIDAL